MDRAYPGFSEKHGITDDASFQEFLRTLGSRGLTKNQKVLVQGVIKKIASAGKDVLSTQVEESNTRIMDAKIQEWKKALEKGNSSVGKNQSSNSVINVLFGASDLATEISNGNQEALDVYRAGIVLVSNIYTKHLKTITGETRRETPLQYLPVTQEHLGGSPINIDWEVLSHEERTASILTIMELTSLHSNGPEPKVVDGLRTWVQTNVNNFRPDTLERENIDTDELANISGSLALLDAMSKWAIDDQSRDTFRSILGGIPDRQWDALMFLVTADVLGDLDLASTENLLRPLPTGDIPPTEEEVVNHQSARDKLISGIKGAYNQASRMLITVIHETGRNQLEDSPAFSRGDTAIHQLGRPISWTDLETTANKTMTSSKNPSNTAVTLADYFERKIEDEGWIMPATKDDAKATLMAMLPKKRDDESYGSAMWDPIFEKNTLDAYNIGIMHRLAVLMNFETSQEGAVPIGNWTRMLLELPTTANIRPGMTIDKLAPLLQKVSGIALNKSLRPVGIRGQEYLLTPQNSRVLANNEIRLTKAPFVFEGYDRARGPRRVLTDTILDSYPNPITAIANEMNYLNMRPVDLMRRANTLKDIDPYSEFSNRNNPPTKIEEVRDFLLAHFDQEHPEFIRVKSVWEEHERNRLTEHTQNQGTKWDRDRGEWVPLSQDEKDEAINRIDPNFEKLVRGVVRDYYWYWNTQERRLDSYTKGRMEFITRIKDNNPDWTWKEAEKTFDAELETLKNTTVTMGDLLNEVLYRMLPESKKQEDGDPLNLHHGFAHLSRGTFMGRKSAERFPSLGSFSFTAKKLKLPPGFQGVNTYGLTMNKIDPEDDPPFIHVEGGELGGSPLKIFIRPDPTSEQTAYLPFLRIYLRGHGENISYYGSDKATNRTQMRWSHQRDNFIQSSTRNTDQ
jgi:hypothetical protein